MTIRNREVGEVASQGDWARERAREVGIVVRSKRANCKECVYISEWAIYGKSICLKNMVKVRGKVALRCPDYRNKWSL